MDVVVLIAAVLAIARAAISAVRIYRASDVVDQIYQYMTRYGDLFHIALGIFTARLLDYARSTPPAAVAAAIIAATYIVYQIVEDWEAPPDKRSAPKDIAVYTATITVTLATLWGIPL
ncbi:MAG: hypothetical protein ACP5MH_11400, partial [Thermoproteus sp.]